MKKNLLLAAFLLMLLGCVFQKPTIDLGDKTSDTAPKAVMVSKAGDDRSHAPGQDCLNCHQPNRGSETWFSLAGTIFPADGYQAAPGGAVELYDQPGGRGALLKRIEADPKGNFYTTEALSFSDSLYVKVIGVAGTERFKPMAVTGGSCNRCHGPETERIRVD